MRKHLLVLTSAALMAVAAPSLALDPVDTNTTYIVQQGDDLWTLAGENLGDPELWRELVARNSFLDEPGRRYTRSDGKVVVVIRPGEKLQGLKTLGLQREPIESPVLESKPTASTWPGSSTWIMLAIAAGLLGLAYWLWSIRRDPATSGRPMVDGGVNTPDQAMAEFQRRGEQQHFDVIESTPGVLNGLVTVSYGDGSSRQRLLTNELGYRALVQYRDGRREHLYMLQRCGNDLKFGGIHRYLPGPDFRFEPTAEPLAPAAATPDTAATIEQGVDNDELQPGQVTCEFRAGKRGETDLLRIKGVNPSYVHVLRDQDGVTFRFNSRRAA